MSDTETAKVEQDVKNAVYAFLVIKQQDGRYAIANVNNDETERQPTMDDVMQALNTLNRDLDRQATAMAVAQLMQNLNGGGAQQTAGGVVLPNAEKKFVKRSR